MAGEDLLAARNRKDVGLGQALGSQGGNRTHADDLSRYRPPTSRRLENIAELFPAVTRYLPPS